MEALLSVQLQVDGDGCVYGDGSDGRVTVVWPLGYTVRGNSTTFDILDADGEVAASSGATLAIGGGVVDATSDTWHELECATGTLWLF